MFIVRPMAVVAGTQLSNLNWKERFFISWIGPRGIVAAAVASLFAAQMSAKGIAGGYELRALVFMVIAVTVISAGLTGGAVAGILGLKRPSQAGWVILGANGLARAMARIFKESGQEAICIDSNAEHCQAAQEDCTRVIYGNGLRSRYLKRAEIDTRMGALALTPNDEVNYLFIQNVRTEAREVMLYCALQSENTSLTSKMIHHEGGKILFGGPVEVEAWSLRLKRKQVGLQVWKFNRDSAEGKQSKIIGEYSGNQMVFAAFRRNEKITPASDATQIMTGDEGYFLVFSPETAAAEKFLRDTGWEKVSSVAENYFTTSICNLSTEIEGL
jgi:NhaP-type Na+/H+ and K+/H+ antiporter